MKHNELVAKIGNYFALFMVIAAIISVAVMLFIDAHTVCDKISGAWNAKGQHYDPVCTKSHIDWSK